MNQLFKSNCIFVSSSFCVIKYMVYHQKNELQSVFLLRAAIYIALKHRMFHFCSFCFCRLTVFLSKAEFFITLMSLSARLIN